MILLELSENIFFEILFSGDDKAAWVDKLVVSTKLCAKLR